jgi:Double zinc ribbon
VPDEQRRCPNCDALVATDAAWCGQCFTSLVEPLAADPVPEATRSSPAVGAPERKEAFWPCPVCDTANPLEADACVTCGTPFAELMRSEPERKDVEAKDALAWSLIFPGLGHRLVGRGTDGIARGVLFAIAFAMALLVGFGGAGSGPALGVFALFLATALGVYVLSAIEAVRLANGGELIVASRVLLWLLVLVIFLAVAMLAVAVVTATRR